MCFNFGLHVMGLFQPVADIGQNPRAIADRGLIALCQPCLDFNEFRFHDPELKIDDPDRDIECGGLVWRCLVRIRARGGV